MKFATWAAAAVLSIAPFAAQAVTTTEVGDLDYTTNGHALQLWEMTDGTDTATASGTVTTDGINFDPFVQVLNDLSNGSLLTGELITGPASTTAGSVKFKFQAVGSGLVATNFSTESPLAAWTGLEISWLDSNMNVLSTLDSNFNSTTLFTTFAEGEEQFLMASWDGYTNNGSNLDFRVEAAIPVPAGVLLIGTAFLAAGAARRFGRKAA